MTLPISSGSRNWLVARTRYSDWPSVSEPPATFTFSSARRRVTSASVRPTADRRAGVDLDLDLLLLAAGDAHRGDAGDALEVAP